MSQASSVFGEFLSTRSLPVMCQGQSVLSSRQLTSCSFSQMKVLLWLRQMSIWRFCCFLIAEIWRARLLVFESLEEVRMVLIVMSVWLLVGLMGPLLLPFDSLASRPDPLLWLSPCHQPISGCETLGLKDKGV